MVIAEFPDFATAEARYRSPEYQAIIPFWQGCAMRLLSKSQGSFMATSRVGQHRGP